MKLSARCLIRGYQSHCCAVSSSVSALAVANSDMAKATVHGGADCIKRQRPHRKRYWKKTDGLRNRQSLGCIMFFFFSLCQVHAALIGQSNSDADRSQSRLRVAVASPPAHRAVQCRYLWISSHSSSLVACVAPSQPLDQGKTRKVLTGTRAQDPGLNRPGCS